MTLNSVQIKELEQVLTCALRHKFSNYKPEPNHMPFHTSLLGKDKMALFSFIHSLNTNFGSSIFEPIAKVLAQTKFADVQTQISMPNKISEQAQRVIQNIMDDLTSANVKPNKLAEINAIRSVCTAGTMRTIKTTKVDIFLYSFADGYYLIDLKTAKPNKGGFKEYKRTMLEWTAVMLAQNPCANVHTLIAIPYNPYAPKPYSRWTMAGMLDLPYELKVADEFWDFLAGANIYNDLLDIFAKVGKTLRPEIDAYFKKYLT